uniref:Putative type II secretion system protein E n=1 Tax=Leptospirillum sp. Group II '5-way CG' TaxID=419541 RepID=B6APA6_9BACT|nr:MAG: Putative type II secretion system protein E [Leptospirillum sp. Group II '5-way CG']
MSDFPLSPNRRSSGDPGIHLKGKNLGEIFEAAGFLSKDQAAQLSAEARASGLRIQEGAVGLGFLSEEQVTSALALQSGFSALSPAEIDALIRRDALFEHRDLYLLQNALPLSDGRIAVDDPANIPVIARDLGISSFSSSRWCLAPRSYLSWRLSDLLGTGRVDILARLKTVFENPDSSPTKLLETLLESAWKIKASDIHIEPFSRFVRIRGRVEGHLRFWVSVTRETFDPVGNLIRTQSGLSNRSGMKSHDGEFTFMVERTEIPVRVSLIPTIHRQFSIVLRLLGAGPGMAIVPEVLGFSPDTLSRLSLISDLSSGMALVTGPTGSGKNTSLHAFFRRTIEKRPGTAFVEVADPIEYRLGQGVQSQVWRSETDQWSYGDALRSTLRHDPDIIMVGEIRDAETAGIALEAALTGHLLLSTLHVTEASAVFDRMGRLGLPPDDLLSVLRIVVNQRLVGRLCPSCRFETKVSGLPSVMETLAREKGIRSLWDAGKPDCPSCRGMGVLGRYAACEVMVLDHEIRRVLSKERTFGAVPLLETYRTLDPRFEPLPEILLKDAAEGKTGLSEILRIVGAVI